MCEHKIHNSNLYQNNDNRLFRQVLISKYGTARCDLEWHVVATWLKQLMFTPDFKFVLNRDFSEPLR